MLDFSYGHRKISDTNKLDKEIKLSDICVKNKNINNPLFAFYDISQIDDINSYKDKEYRDMLPQDITY